MNRTGSTGWLFQRASGALIFVLVAVHFALMHYMGPEKRLYADVARRFANPLWKTFDIVFLAAAVPHGWYGVWGIVQDYVGSAALRAAALVAITAAALVLLCIGFMTVASFHAV